MSAAYFEEGDDSRYYNTRYFQAVMCRKRRGLQVREIFSASVRVSVAIRSRSSTLGCALGSGNDLKVEAPLCHFKQNVGLLLEPHVSFSAFSAFFSTARLSFIYISEMPDVISFLSVFYCCISVLKSTSSAQLLHFHSSAISRVYFFSSVVSIIRGSVIDPLWVT